MGGMRGFGVVLAVAAVAAGAPAHAYDPGSGTVFTEDFDGTLDPDWEQGNGIGQPSPWQQVQDGADESFYADGYGPFGISPTEHWARHFLHPVSATSCSVALEYRSELGTGYMFELDLQQRAPTLRKYRLTIDGNGALALWRTEGGSFVQMANAGSGTVPVNHKRWIRFAIEPGSGGHPLVRARVWSGKATAEPTTWTVEFLDELDTLERVHRMELDADGPRGVETWLDDLDVYGDAGRGVVSSVVDVYVAELSHLDIGFTLPPDDIEAFAKSHLDQVLDNLDADPDYRWFIESGWWLDRWWERSTDAERQRMVDALRSGRMALDGGYANFHTTVLGQEEMTRAIYFSTRFGREHGVPIRTWITDDVPGSTYALPELLSRAGIDYYLGGMNCSFGGRLTAPNHGDRPFWWVGPDGSRVLAWITFDSYAEAFQYGFSFFDTLADMYDKLAQKLPEQEEAGYHWPELMIFRGFDNHYQGFHARDLVNQWNATYETPVFHLITPAAFLDMMLQKYGAQAFPEFTGDFGGAWAGSRSNAQHTQEWIRQAHRNARSAEALLSAGSAVDGKPYPQSDADFLYRKMLESDEHTGAGGWPGYFTPEEMDRNNRIHLGYAQDARDTARALLDQGLDRALAELPAAGDAVAAVNPLGRERDGWVRTALPQAIYDTAFRVVDRATAAEVPYQRFDATREILFRAQAVPAMGYKVFDLVPGDPTAVPPGMLAVTPTTLENDSYLLTVDPSDGSVTSLVEKATGRELVDTTSPYRFNELAWNLHSEATSQLPPNAEPPQSASTQVEWSGPLVASIKVTRTGTPHVETTYRLYRGEDRVEIENVLDRDKMPYVPNSEHSRLFVVTMPFDIPDFEIRSETTTRFLDPVRDGFQRDGVFDWHDAEHTLAFWDTGGGILYSLDSVFAHHFENLSTLTSPSFSTGNALLLSRLYDKADEYEFEDGSIGPYEIEPGTSPIFHYVHHLRATPAGFDPVAASRFGFEALTPLEARVLSHGPGNLPGAAASFFRVDAPGVLPYTVKNAEVGEGFVMRMTELTGVATTAQVDSDVLILEQPERVEQDEEGGTPLPSGSGGFSVDLAPHETATVRFTARPSWQPIVLQVDKDPAAGVVRLTWSGGVTPFTLERADDAVFMTNRTVLVDEQDTNSHDDPALQDGTTHYYLAR